MADINKEPEDEQNWQEYMYGLWWLIPIIVILAFIMVIVLTRQSLINSFDLTQTGAIGDTIGGITAPLFNLLASILIFVSFRAQVRANKMQFTALNAERIKSRQSEQLQQLSNALNKFEYEYRLIQFDYISVKVSYGANNSPIINRYKSQNRGTQALSIITEILGDVSKDWAYNKHDYRGGVFFVGKHESTYYDYSSRMLENTLRDISYVYSLLDTLTELLKNYEFENKNYFYNQAKAFLNKSVAELVALLEVLEKVEVHSEFSSDYRRILSQALSYFEIKRQL